VAKLATRSYRVATTSRRSWHLAAAKASDGFRPLLTAVLAYATRHDHSLDPYYIAVQVRERGLAGTLPDALVAAAVEVTSLDHLRKEC